MIDDEKWHRVGKSAKHFLASVMFYQSSNEAYTAAGTSLLSCIGCYYVGYHSAVSMLWLQASVPAEKMKRLRHSQVKALIEQHLIQEQKLDRDFMTAYDELQELREYANYNFGSKNPRFEYQQVVPTLKAKTGEILNKAVNVLLQDLNSMDMFLAFQATIGDDIGSDLIRLHSTEQIGDKVWEYLIAAGMTT